MSDAIGLTIIGAGVVGCAVARELARAGEDVLVLERNPGVTQGENQSSRNSGVIHSGLYYDQATRPLKAAMCVEGNRLLHEFCAERQVPALACGKLVVATQPEHHEVLELYEQRCHENGVPVELISGERARELEPRVACLEALLLPSAGVVDAPALVHRLYALASGHGAQFMTQTALSGAKATPEGLELSITYRDGAKDAFLTKRLVNCAGLYADEVARLLHPESPHVVDPTRSESVKFYRAKRPELGLQNMNVYPTPTVIQTDKGTHFTVGVHLTPTLAPGPDGKPALGPEVTIGPLGHASRSKEDYGGDYPPMEDFHARVAPFFPGLRAEDLQEHQVGIQPRLVNTPDFVVELCPAEPRLLSLVGIDSPGLTSSLALAKLAKKMLGLA
ncbi:MAG: FAD-dependent oxidoreductase [Desulfarculaceae bacterium]|nr:FAD-dependent oxidoreductase [Desulfarculaceae bacterium]MCF8071250.1 FAD-dependent oxidoreductase [Desulfarculaceae bacterium]MCF8101147.1 FAD-dependent oxidoreductase [Desulfarculaceae bacterium]MCF8115304.1 FAD-dependent oxidoreductase [Desulfarculaceae bacterium]